MKTSLYVSFPDNAREALEFYHEVFGGELDIMTYGEQPGGGDDLQNNSSTLERGVFGFTAGVESTDEGEQLIAKLTRGGGKVTMPFAKAPWGAHFGGVEDKFGLAWNISTGDGR